jgi:two-component system chemotaxis response regulator CheY
VIKDVYGVQVGGGFQVVGEAGSGEETVSVVKTAKPDLLLLDLSMPRMSGLDALREIMRLDDSIAVIMVTGNAQLPLTIDAIRSGAFGYVPKPFDFRYLDHMLATIFDKPRNAKR